MIIRDSGWSAIIIDDHLFSHMLSYSHTLWWHMMIFTCYMSLGWFLDEVRVSLGWFWDEFGMILRRFGHYFEVILGCFLNDFGMSLKWNWSDPQAVLRTCSASIWIKWGQCQTTQQKPLINLTTSRRTFFLLPGKVTPKSGIPPNLLPLTSAITVLTQ